jgi:hypothetical protein
MAELQDFADWMQYDGPIEECAVKFIFYFRKNDE